jgi:hypothetical protein
MLEAALLPRKLASILIFDFCITCYVGSGIKSGSGSAKAKVALAFAVPVPQHCSVPNGYRYLV